MDPILFTVVEVLELPTGERFDTYYELKKFVEERNKENYLREQHKMKSYETEEEEKYEWNSKKCFR